MGSNLQTSFIDDPFYRYLTDFEVPLFLYLSILSECDMLNKLLNVNIFNDKFYIIL